MGKYLKKFESHSQYESYIATDYVKPNVSLCVQENHVHYNPIPHDYSEDYLTFVALEDGTFKLSGNNISYSIDDGTTWTTLQSNTDSPIVSNGNKILWKGELSGNNVGHFYSTGNYAVQGNIMSLLYSDNFEEQEDITNSTFSSLFSNNSKLISAENLVLPSTTLSDWCYWGMFSNCTGLTTAPELPATTLAQSCYGSMFINCTSLTTTPELPATTLANYCYSSMFDGCTSLTTAPELPAETLAQNCYSSMFEGCTSLTTAPELSATTLAERCCYRMFYGCTSLTTAPELPATTLVTNCYYYMFYNCSSLNYIKAMFTTTPSSTYTQYWVSGVAATGTFVKNAAAEWDVSGVHGVPTGWTVQTAST